MRDSLRVAIAGGGIGGLTAAVALRNAGASPTVFERASDIRHVQLGGSIHIWPNGYRALAAAGLADAVRESVDDGAVMRRQYFLTASGRTFIDWDLSESALGLPTLAVVRGEFHSVLAESAGDMIRLGAGVEGFDADDDGVSVALADGREERFDVLIGADGLRSTVRRGVVGSSEPVFTDYTTWLSVIPLRHPLLENTLRVYFGRGGRFTVWPVSRGRVYWEAIYSAEAGGVDGAGGRQADVLERFGDWAEPVPEAIRATPDEAIARADSYTHPVLERWGFGRVTMIGDAAHAMTNAAGQGANQALEDAAVLARCLDRNDDPSAGLREYESIRHKRATTYVKRSKMIARAATVHNPVMGAVRTGMMAVALRVLFGQFKKDLSYDAGAM